MSPNYYSLLAAATARVALKQHLFSTIRPLLKQLPFLAAFFKLLRWCSLPENSSSR